MKKILLFGMLTLLFFSCKKKESSEAFIFPANVIAGDTLDTRMTFIRNDIDTVSFLDLNSDGVTDLQFYGFYSMFFGGGVLEYAGSAAMIKNPALQILTTSNASTQSSPFNGYFYAYALNRGENISRHDGVWNTRNSLLSEIWVKNYTYPPLVVTYDSAGQWYKVSRKFLAFLLGEKPGWICLSTTGGIRVYEIAIMR